MNQLKENKIIIAIIASVVMLLSYVQDVSAGKFYIPCYWNDSTWNCDSLCVLWLREDSSFVYFKKWRGPIDEISCGRWKINNDVLILYSDKKYITHPKILYNRYRLDYCLLWQQYDGLKFVMQTDSLIVSTPFQDAKCRQIHYKDRSINTQVKSKNIQEYSFGKKNSYIFDGKVDIKSIKWTYRLVPISVEIEFLIQEAREILSD
ncbi:MAG: hypothetical protein MJZ82_05230 [Paludibacteraceae bacterium]|nr:hypothetical protein [Paludibacteraceae bacterium]